MSVKSISSRVRKSLERTLTGFFILGQLVFPFMAAQPVLADAPGDTSTPVSVGTITPYIINGANPGGNRTCAEVGTAFFGDANYYATSSEQFDEGDQFSGTTGPITWSTVGDTYVTWSGNTGGLAIVVKGSNDANVYVYDSTLGAFLTTDSGLASPIAGGSSTPATLSNITFCYNETTPDPEAFLTLKKNVIGGTATQDDFTPLVDSSTTILLQSVEWDTKLTLTPDTYTVDEDTPLPANYTQTDITCYNTGDSNDTVDEPVVLEDGDDVTCEITNTFQAPTTKEAKVQLRKVVVPSDDNGEFTLKINGDNDVTGGDGTTTGSVNVNLDNDNDVVFSETGANGTLLSNYTTDFDCWNQNGPIDLYFDGVRDGDSSRSVTVSDVDDGDEVLCQVTNTRVNDAPKPATIHTVKIECEAEEYLPNWGDGQTGPSTIVEATADNWLAEGDNSDNCEKVDWEFQWTPDPTTNPGDEIEEANSPWQTFEDSVEVSAALDKVWLREVFDDEYIGFSGGTTQEGQEGSAELYCHADVLNFDNWEFVDNLQPGGNYYCIAWNVEKDDGNVGGDNDAKITVKKFQDDNGNGQKDNNEDYIEDWLINLYDENENQVDSGLTDANGQVLFDNLSAGKYFICEIAKPGWTQTAPTTGDIVPAIGLNEADNCIEDELASGSSLVCTFGNMPPEAQLLIEKTNDAADTLLPGADVVYTITVTNPEDSNDVFDAVVGDVLPDGFDFQSVVSVNSDVRGDITGQPYFSVAYNANNFGQWHIGDLVPGEVVTISYLVEIGADVPAGTYENVAFVIGCEDDEQEVCKNPVVGDDESPEEDDDKFAESKVTVGAVLGVSQPRVLAVTGTPMASSLVVGSLVSSLAGLLTLSRKQLRALRRFFSGFKKMSRSAVLVLVFTLMSAVPALAANWKLEVTDLATVRNESTTLAYSVATIEESDSFNAALDVDGPVDYTKSASFSGSQARTFAVDFPEDGNYTLNVTVENITQGGTQSDTQSVLVDTDGDGNGSQSSADNGGSAFSGAGLVGGSDQFGVVSTTAATDSNQADDAEGEEQAATDDQTDDQNDENGDEADENGDDDENSEDEDSNILPTILTIAAVALVGYYFLSRRGVE